MAQITEVRVEPKPLERFAPLIGADAVAAADEHAQRVRERLGAHSVWNVNSTATGGGVAEMLATLLAYPRDRGIDVRWVVIEGSVEFFRITKRLHHALHGSPGGSAALDDDDRAIYELVLNDNAEELLRLMTPGDVVILHDPQTAGLAPRLREAGMFVIWRSHVGTDDHASRDVVLGWRFLLPYVRGVPIAIFSRRAYIPDALGDGRALVIPPSIDPFSPKSEPLDPVTVRAVLERAGLLAGPGADRPATFTGVDGAPRTVDRSADVVRDGGPAAPDAPLVVQVSRWDPLKDPIGVMDGFARMVSAGRGGAGATLLLAGPQVTGVADDPEAGVVLRDAIGHWESLPDAVRSRIQLASLPTADVVENASIVDALQSHASVIVQKSLREGFGLSVTEAMWKARPVVASAVGGIVDQVEDGRSGVLVDDPRDRDAFATKLAGLLENPERAESLGAAARERVREEFLPVRHLVQYAQLIERCMEAAST